MRWIRGMSWSVICCSFTISLFNCWCRGSLWHIIITTALPLLRSGSQIHILNSVVWSHPCSLLIFLTHCYTRVILITLICLDHTGSTGPAEHFLRTTPLQNMAAANFVLITNVSLMDTGISNWTNSYFSQKQTTPERPRNFQIHVFHHYYY